MKNARGKLILVGLFAIPFMWVVLWHNVEFGSTPLPVLGSIVAEQDQFNSDIILTDQRGITSSLEAFKGQSYIAGFFSSEYEEEYPILLGHIKILTQKLVTSTDIQFHSYSLDSTETVTSLDSVATNFEADHKQWKWYTGKYPDIIRLESLHIAALDSQAMAKDILKHSVTLYLVDKDGMIRAICDGTDTHEVFRMVDAAHHLLKSYQIINEKSSE